jgi:hypothetical protein
MTGLSRQPRLLKGALVDSNVLAVPPLVVPFQFNPERLTRRRSVRLQAPASRRGREEEAPADESLGDAQTTQTAPETISLDVRLDATDALEAGDPVAEEFGVLPALSSLELMITPRSDTLLSGRLGLSTDFGFGDRRSIPALLFVWGRYRVIPVRLTDLTIQEVEYTANLSPSRVIVSVSLQVLGGTGAFQRFVQAEREALAALNARSAPDLTRSIVPR